MVLTLHGGRPGFLGLGGLTLPWLPRTRAEAAALAADFVHDKAVVLVFLAGGASHIETFNPNVDGPEPDRRGQAHAAGRGAGRHVPGTGQACQEDGDRPLVTRTTSMPVIGVSPACP